MKYRVYLWREVWGDESRPKSQIAWQREVATAVEAGHLAAMLAEGLASPRNDGQDWEVSISRLPLPEAA